PEQQQGLRELGVTAGQIQNIRSRTPDGAAIWWRNDFRFYCDQMAYDFYAPYHTPALKDKEQRMKEAKVLYKSDRTKKDAFFRQPCLNDHDAEAKALARISQVVSAQRRFRPFFYSTDETGVANLVEAWDFCFCPLTLKAMRTWLLQQYGSLEAINRGWDTKFNSLDEVTPLSTDEMMKRGDENLAPWADHRTFMNLTFAQEAKKASEAARKIDPTAIAGLVGCQMPSAFGGYDYWLLSQSIDVAEPYNIGNNREIWRSFAPKKPALTTGFGADDHEVWRLWYQALHGDKGVIIYDEQNRYLDSSGKPTPLGLLVAPTYRELTGGIAKQLHYMERVNDPIAIHYSHPSITAHWMIEHRPLGEAWVDKRSAYERQQSDFLRLRHSAVYLLEDNLQQYYFVSYAQLEDGAFDKMSAKVMILPQSVAMSKAECDALRRFVDRGGWLIADCRTALMDSHCKLQAKGQLDDLFGIERRDLRYAPGPVGLSYTGTRNEARLPTKLERVSTAEPGINVAQGAVAMYRDADGTPAVIVNNHGKGRTIYLNAVITDYHRWRLQPPEGESLRQFVASWLREAGVGRQYEIAQSDGQPALGIEIHPWRSGDLRVLGIQRNYGMNVSDLGPARYQKQDALEAPLELKVDFGKIMALYDTRRGEFLGNRRDYTIKVDKIQPTILTVLSQPVQSLTIEAPHQAKAGDLVEVQLQLLGTIPGSTHALRVALQDPSGNELRMLTRNLAAPDGKVVWEAPLAADAPRGVYTLVVRDIATGTKTERPLVIR
ncbi:MAG TPA: beta-galactosidase trimerization domain-containing protein, partial [Acidobacteriota bacterium]|nr:beta-galactosidase trimerization domain-containing protein [Acidobacteriota bacterium]